MKTSGFSKNQRLLTAYDFSCLRQNTEVFRTKSFKAIYKRREEKISRLGLAVSRKVGKAVKRNRIKRLVREWFRQSDVKETGIDIIFSFSPYLKNLSKDLAEERILNDLKFFSSILLKKLGELK